VGVRGRRRRAATYQTPLPWGGDPSTPASCEQTTIGRGPFPFDNDCNRDGKSFGLLPVQARSAPGGDVSLGLGVVNLAGNVGEFALDSFAPFAANCWASQPLASPACLATPATSYTLRGATWADAAISTFLGRRSNLVANGVSALVGFRCVRPGT
jgi:formylglycine-generating enzyme required for sulfatase activity